MKYSTQLNCFVMTLKLTSGHLFVCRPWGAGDIICYESYQKYLWYMMKSLICRPETQSLLFCANKPEFSCTGSISHVGACSNLPTETKKHIKTRGLFMFFCSKCSSCLLGNYLLRPKTDGTINQFHLQAILVHFYANHWWHRLWLLS